MTVNLVNNWSLVKLRRVESRILNGRRRLSENRIGVWRHFDVLTFRLELGELPPDQGKVFVEEVHLEQLKSYGGPIFFREHKRAIIDMFLPY